MGELGKATAPTASSKKDRRPTPDQMYLAAKLNGDALWVAENYVEEVTKPHQITPAVLQKWNLIYGVAAVTSALRNAWGFPPLDGIENPFAYVAAILRAKP